MARRDWNEAGGDWNSNTESWGGEAEFPAKADLTLTGSIPQRSAGESRVPAAGSATFVTSYPWDLVSGTWADTSGTWASPAINVPSVAVGTVIEITKGSVTLSTVAPAYGIDHYALPAKGDLTSSSVAPAAGLGKFIVPGVGTMQIFKSYEWNSYTGNWSTGTTDWESPPNTFASPSISIGENVLPGVNTLTITGATPDVDIMRLTYVPSASMTTTLFIPYAVAGHFALVDAGALDLSPDKVIWNNWVGDWDSAIETWDAIVDTRPSVGQTFSFDVTEGDLVLTGQDVDPQHRAPKFLPSVQVI